MMPTSKAIEFDQSRGYNDIDPERCWEQWLEQGMTRSDLLKVFTTEGGLSAARRRTFIHRRCPYIKVDIDFTLFDPKQSAVDERPTDTVSGISRPYLDWSIADWRTIAHLIATSSLAFPAFGEASYE